MIVKFIFEDDTAATQFSDLMLVWDHVNYGVWVFNSKYKLFMIRYSGEWLHHVDPDDTDQMSSLFSLILSVGYSDIQVSISTSK
ncbi:MAG TPA: hypothetical protein VMR16_04015 [Candidatus Saccharimonadales bacterium]|nr:hypothetical protein [Candidatus Saccharimonadales bacterium]